MSKSPRKWRYDQSWRIHEGKNCHHVDEYRERIEDRKADLKSCLTRHAAKIARYAQRARFGKAGVRHV